MRIGLSRVMTALMVLGLAVGGAALARDGALRGHGGPVKSVSVSADGKSALTGSFDYSMIYWRLGEGAPRVVQRIDDHDGAVNSAKFIAGGNRVVTASDDGTVAVWDLASGTLVHRFKGHSHKVVSVVVSDDGRLAASAAWDRTVRLWNLDTLTPGPELKGHSNTVNGVAFAPDGSSVYSAGYDGEVRKWRTSDGTLTGIVYKHGWGINAIALVGNGQKMVFGSLDGTVGLVDVASGSVRELHRFERPVLSLGVSADKSMVAAGSGDGFISVWDTGNWKTKYRHQFAEGPVWALAFSHDGDGMYFGGLDDHVAYWQMRPDQPFKVAQSKIPRRFQKSEGLGPGERQFARKCSICHSLGEDHANRAGPSLIGVFGRKAGSVPGYAYSKTLKEADFIWTAETIDKLFAQGPEHFVPGSKMPLQKMARAQERLALIEYLKRATRLAPVKTGTQSGG